LQAQQTSVKNRDPYLATIPWHWKRPHAGHVRRAILASGSLLPVCRQRESCGPCIPFWRLHRWSDELDRLSEWERRLSHAPAILVTELANRRLKIRLGCRDAVDFYENVYLRGVTVENLSSQERETTLFFHDDFHFHGTSIADTALYDPRLEGIIDYKERRYFLINVLSA
jgi:hypothetical protein